MSRLYWGFLLLLISASHSARGFAAPEPPSFSPSWKPTFHAATAFDSRPPGAVIDTVVLHATERRFLWQVIEYFSRPSAKASAHFTIDRDGKVIQHVEITNRAWHAGESKMLDGRSSVNDFSIGIELVNLNDGKDPYPEPQREALRQLIAFLREQFPIRHIVTHAQIAVPPGRKSDPLGFRLEWIEKDPPSDRPDLQAAER